MPRLAKGTITFIYNLDEDPLFEMVGDDWTDEQRLEYFTETMAEDVTQASYGDLTPFIEMEIVNA